MIPTAGGVPDFLQILCHGEIHRLLPVLGRVKASVGDHTHFGLEMIYIMLDCQQMSYVTNAVSLVSGVRPTHESMYKLTAVVWFITDLGACMKNTLCYMYVTALFPTIGVQSVKLVVPQHQP